MNNVYIDWLLIAVNWKYCFQNYTHIIVLKYLSINVFPFSIPLFSNSIIHSVYSHRRCIAVMLWIPSKPLNCTPLWLPTNRILKPYRKCCAINTSIIGFSLFAKLNYYTKPNRIERKKIRFDGGNNRLLMKKKKTLPQKIHVQFLCYLSFTRYALLFSFTPKPMSRCFVLYDVQFNLPPSTGLVLYNAVIISYN